MTKEASAARGPDIRYISRAEAANLLGCSVRHLERLGAEGGGPLFIRHGTKTVYRMDRLLAWADAQGNAEPASTTAAAVQP